MREAVLLPTGRRRRVLTTLLLCFGSLLSCARSSTPTAEWKLKPPPLSTRWTSEVSPTNALPEYPRPQMVRPDWQNLNGVWQFAAATQDQPPPINQELAERVLVPFPVESGLSGIQRHGRYASWGTQDA